MAFKMKGSAFKLGEVATKSALKAYKTMNKYGNDAVKFGSTEGKSTPNKMKSPYRQDDTRIQELKERMNKLQQLQKDNPNTDYGTEIGDVVSELRSLYESASEKKDETGSPLPYTAEYTDFIDPKTGEIKGSKRETKPIPKTKGVETELTKRREKAAEAGYELPGGEYKGKDATIESGLVPDWQIPKLIGTQYESQPMSRLDGYDALMAETEGGTKKNPAAERKWEQFKKDNPDSWKADEKMYKERVAKGDSNIKNWDQVSSWDKKALEEQEAKTNLKGTKLWDHPSGTYKQKLTGTDEMGRVTEEPWDDKQALTDVSKGELRDFYRRKSAGLE